ncbi:MAG TPA: siderophore-interacting protein [Acidothermaceae bacterium]
MTELPAASTHLLSVADVVDVGPRMRRITIGGDALAEFVALPGQDVVVHVSDGHGGGVSRRYTIRNLDTEVRRLDLDVVMHGDGPGAAWAASVAIGDGVEVFGPRGKVLLAAAGWQLFVGDESAIPAIAEMIGALPVGTAAIALIEVTDADDEQSIRATGLVDVRWLHRRATPPGESELLHQAVTSIEIPDVDRHAYLFGESRVVRRLRDDLGGRGLQPHEISAKGYWNLGRVSGH